VAGPGAPQPDVGRVVERVQTIVTPIVAVHRCELVSVELRREPIGWVLRLYVERLGHDPRLAIGGVTLEDCTSVSRDVSAALDVHEVLEHAYHLEVSSPGLDRPLVKPADFVRFVGLRARLHLGESLAAHPKRRGFKGEILAADDVTIRFRDDDVGELEIPHASVQNANLVYDEPPKPKPGKPMPGKTKPKPSKHSPSAKQHGRTADTKPDHGADEASAPGSTHQARRS
jgi:ribosome maturation factor RimP